jgi:hypothetical protein
MGDDDTTDKKTNHRYPAADNELKGAADTMTAGTTIRPARADP